MSTPSVPTISSNTYRIPVILASLVIILAGIKLSSDLIASLLLAVVLTILIYPIQAYLLRKGVSLFWSTLILVVGVLVSFSALAATIAYYISRLIENLPIYQSLLDQRLDGLFSLLEQYNIDTQTIFWTQLESTDQVFSVVISFMQGMISNVVAITIFLFVWLLMVIAAPTFVNQWSKEYENGNNVLETLKEYFHQVQDVYAIQTLSNLLTAASLTIVMLLFDIDFALFWGILIFFLSYIPSIGGILGAIPPLVMAVILNGVFSAGIMLSIMWAVSLSMDNLVTPRFMGESVKVPMVSVFVSMLIWGWLLGGIGVLLALPLTLAVRAIAYVAPQAKPLLLFLTKPQAKTAVVNE